MNISTKLRLLKNIPWVTNSSIVQVIQSRQSSFNSSPFLCDLEKRNIKYEVSKNPEEWKFVERILPPLVVPKPTLKSEYPSNWKPQSKEALKHPYFVSRNRNHMVPVYLKTTHKGQRRLTYIKKIQGDIWLLERDIKTLLQGRQLQPIRSQVNEFVGYICIHGDHDGHFPVSDYTVLRLPKEVKTGPQLLGDKEP